MNELLDLEPVAEHDGRSRSKGPARMLTPLMQHIAANPTHGWTPAFKAAKRELKLEKEADARERNAARAKRQ